MKKLHFVVDGQESVEINEYLKNPETLLEKPNSALNSVLEHACENRKSIQLCCGNNSTPYYEKNATAVQIQRGFSKDIGHFAYVIMLELAKEIGTVK